jgi:hypothetical protein
VQRLLPFLLPLRLRRWRTVLPEEVGTGATPLEAECRPFGKEKQRRLIVATTDPAELPERTTWYLLTNRPAASSLRASESGLEVAEVAEVVRLYSLRS